MVRKIKARFTKGKIEPLENLSLQEGQELVITIEVAPAPEKSHRGSGRFFPGDSMLKLAGIGQGDEATDVSQNIHEYLADAYEHKGQ